jgi:hypothetical protein
MMMLMMSKDMLLEIGTYGVTGVTDLAGARCDFLRLPIMHA